MIEIYADTAYWVAVQLPDDELHSKAMSAVEEIPDGSRIVTSELVMIEFLNHVSRMGHGVREKAANLWSMLEKSPGVEFIRTNSELILKAKTLYESLQDKSWSLTDCASIVIMKERKITNALTSDRHFEQAGFRTLMRD